MFILALCVVLVCLVDIVIRIKLSKMSRGSYSSSSGGKFGNPIKHLILILGIIHVLFAIFQVTNILLLFCLLLLHLFLLLFIFLLLLAQVTTIKISMTVAGLVFPKLLLGLPTSLLLAVFLLKNQAARQFHRARLARLCQGNLWGKRTAVVGPGTAQEHPENIEMVQGSLGEVRSGGTRSRNLVKEPVDLTDPPDVETDAAPHVQTSSL